MLRLRVWSLVGVRMRRKPTDVSFSHCCFFLPSSLSVSPPPPTSSLYKSNNKKISLGEKKKTLHSYTYKFFNLSAVALWPGWLLLVLGCLVHHRMLSSITGLNPILSCWLTTLLIPNEWGFSTLITSSPALWMPTECPTTQSNSELTTWN